MINQEEIERFRREKLPEYIEYVKTKPKIETRVIYTSPVNYVEHIERRKCNKCGKWLPTTEFYDKYHICKACKNKAAKRRYYKKRVEFYREKMKSIK